MADEECRKEYSFNKKIASWFRKLTEVSSRCINEENTSEDHVPKIMHRLMGNTKQLDAISIVGMGGIGKTTLAQKIYNNECIEHHFDIHAWVTVSQAYQKRDLLIAILSSLHIYLTGELHKMKGEELSEKLHKRLKGNRYLIVVDDIWNIEAWDDLKKCFPNDKNGSRIMFTSRIKDVSFQAKLGSKPYELPFLSVEESWDLLQDKIFLHREICPLELVEVGKEIAKNCQGLPLAIIVIGGILTKIEKNEYGWRQVAKSMGSYIASDPKKYMDTLELSYIHLPDHLKPLFLYFGAFPEDCEIPVFKLVWLWIAEGFVKKTGDESLEDTTKDYLTDLIGRSLIVISEKTVSGEVRSCRIHDLLRDLCLRKAEEENFMHIINDGEQVFRRLSPSYVSPSAGKVCRLSINKRLLRGYCPFEHYPNTCSVLMTTNAEWCYDRLLSLGYLRHLKVLDLIDSGSTDQFIPRGIEQAVQLKYLSFPQLSNELAQSISKLRKLETVICLDIEGQNSVKVDISSMIKLKNVKIINPRVHVDVMLDGSSLLIDLHTIYTPWFTCENYYDSLKSTPNLRKLKCTFSNSSIFSSSRGLEFLEKLETLKISYRGLPSVVRWLDFPTSLKKMTLSNFGFEWRDFSKLSMLPKLEVLKLLVNSFKGECWDTSIFEDSNMQFPKLKFLKFEALNILEWNASRDHFPSLQRLVVNSCLQLKEIPSDIGDIPTLETIELKWCSRSTAESVRQILEEQQSMGNEQLKIFIYPPNS